jgi:hypothetical protein
MLSPPSLRAQLNALDFERAAILIVLLINKAISHYLLSLPSSHLSARTWASGVVVSTA